MTAPGGRRQGGDVAGGGTAALRGALLIGVAVVLGVVLLGKGIDSGIIPSSDDTSAERDETEEATDDHDDGGGEDGGGTTTTVAAARPPAEVKVFVLNGSGASGIAGAGTDKAAAAGYQTAPAANVPEGQNVTSSVIYFIEGYQADAQAVAGVLQVPLSPTTVQPLPNPLPPAIPDGDVKGANVIAVLGTDAPPG